MDLLDGLLCIDPHNKVSVLLQNMLHETTVLQQFLLDVRMLVLWLVLQSIQDCFVLDVLRQNEVELVRHWVESPLFKFLVDQVVTHVKSKNKTWLQIQFFEHGNLLDCCWGSYENPTICFTVWHLQSLSQVLINRVSWNFPIFKSLSQIIGLLPFSS